MDKWQKLRDIISSKNYSRTDLMLILEGWYTLLDCHAAIPNNSASLHNAVMRAISMMKMQSERDDNSIFLKALRYILNEDSFSATALNQFLKEVQVPYHYVLPKGEPLQRGEFRQGYDRKPPIKKRTKFNRIFISHSSKDQEMVRAFVTLLESIGLGPNEIFCSSLDEYGVRLDDNIINAMFRELSGKKSHVIFMLSKNYYDSPICLNEMGAAWIMRHNYTSILLPGTEFKEIAGSIDAWRIGIKLDGEQDSVKNRLIELRDILQKEFELRQINEMTWNRKVGDFLEKIDTLSHKAI